MGEENSESDLQIIGASIHRDAVVVLDEMVKTGRYRSRSHAIDVAVMQFVERERNASTMGTSKT